MVRNRIRLLIAFLLIPFGVVMGQLASLQLFRDPETLDELSRAEGRRRRIVLRRPTRGAILDRSGAALARDAATFDLHFTLYDLHPRERYLPVLERALLLCDERCRTPEPDPDPSDPAPPDLPGAPVRYSEEGGACRGVVLEEHLQEVLAPVIDGLPAEPAGLDGDPVLVDNIPPLLRARIHQKLRGGLPALERATGLYFIRARDGEKFELRARPREVLILETTLKRLAALTGEPYDELRAQVAQAQAEVAAARNETERDIARRQKSRLLLSGISDRALTEVVYQPELFPGIAVAEGRRREYPLREAAAALVGHLRAPGDRELREGLLLDRHPLDDIDFILSEPFKLLRRLGSQELDGAIGARGIEERYDARLRGAYGVRVEEVDARHVSRKAHLDLPPERGEDLRTTLDAELQVLLFEELAALSIPRGDALAGSAVVIDLTGRAAPAGAGPPGAILAACSFPGFDPHRMRNGAYLREIEERQRELHQGILLNRPVQAYQPPGSIFKLVVAAAAMEGGVEWPEPAGRARPAPLLPATRYRCTQFLDPENQRSLRCLSANGHGVPGGELDLIQSLQFSCNIYFYRLGRERLQPQLLWAWARELGFGRSTGVDLDDPEYDPSRPRHLQARVGREGMCQYAIGQTYVLASPLQVLRAVAAIALGGSRLPWPYLATPREPERLGMRPETARSLREGMVRAVHALGGTAAAEELGLCRYRAAVKTGTAEINDGDPDALDPALRPLNSAWIAGYAPHERPEIAFVVLLERTALHGGDCARVAVPLLEHFARKEPGKYRVPGLPGRPVPAAAAGKSQPVPAVEPAERGAGR